MQRPGGGVKKTKCNADEMTKFNAEPEISTMYTNLGHFGLRIVNLFWEKKNRKNFS